jgi:broad specificity phosphatase PhoE
MHRFHIPRGGRLLAGLALLFLAPAALAQVCSNLAGSSIYLVRHAEKLDGPDPGLSPAGLARAEALREELADVSLDAIYVTQWQRTQMTAAPIAEAQGLPLTVHSTESRTVSEHVQAVISDLNANHCGDTVLLVGHSNTLPRLIYTLTGKQTGEISEQTYNRLFHIRFEPGRPVEVIRAEYGAPNPVGG